MFSVDDTIVAIATPVGRGGIGVVRISGPDAARIAATLTDLEGKNRGLEPRHATFARVADRRRRPRRRSGHRHLLPARRIRTPARMSSRSAATAAPCCCARSSQAAIGAGARLAEPGEFTLRAFLRERIDLVQAEAVRDLVDAVTPLQARAAYDQLEGTLTARIKAIDERALRSARAARGVAGFSRRGVSLRRVGRCVARDRRNHRRRSTTCSRAAREDAWFAKGCRSRSSGGRTRESRACSTRSPAPAARSSPRSRARRAIC